MPDGLIVPMHLRQLPYYRASEEERAAIDEKLEAMALLAEGLRRDVELLGGNRHMAYDDDGNSLIPGLRRQYRAVLSDLAANLEVLGLVKFQTSRVLVTLAGRPAGRRVRLDGVDVHLIIKAIQHKREELPVSQKVVEETEDDAIAERELPPPLCPQCSGPVVDVAGGPDLVYCRECDHGLLRMVALVYAATTGNADA